MVIRKMKNIEDVKKEKGRDYAKRKAWRYYYKGIKVFS